MRYPLCTLWYHGPWMHANHRNHSSRYRCNRLQRAYSIAIELMFNAQVLPNIWSDRQCLLYSLERRERIYLEAVKQIRTFYVVPIFFIHTNCSGARATSSCLGDSGVDKTFAGRPNTRSWKWCEYKRYVCECDDERNFWMRTLTIRYYRRITDNIRRVRSPATQRTLMETIDGQWPAGWNVHSAPRSNHAFLRTTTLMVELATYTQ